MNKTDILKFKCDLIKRNLALNVYLMNETETKKTMISRTFEDKNVSLFSHFIIDNYRKENTFNYLTWTVLETLADKKLNLYDLKKEFIDEICYTVTPDRKNIIHILSKNYDVLDNFVKYIEEMHTDINSKKDLTISDILFLPDIYGKTPIHYSLETNNSRVTDRLLRAITSADFDHHSRFIIDLYSKLIE
jgi:hypothetical protein